MRIGLLPQAAFLVFALNAGQAQANCVFFGASYAPSDWGAAAGASDACYQPPLGGAGALSAQQGRVDVSASASLATGVLTSFATSGGRYASANLWDTLTFSGLPAAGLLITETLFLTGSIIGNGLGEVSLYWGPAQATYLDYANSVVQFELTKSYFPASVSTQYMVQNGVPVLFVAGMSAYSITSGDTVDLLDPPYVHFNLPDGVNFTSASGAFTNVTSVPEPGTLAMFIGGLAFLMGAGWRRKWAFHAAPRSEPNR